MHRETYLPWLIEFPHRPERWSQLKGTSRLASVKYRVKINRVATPSRGVVKVKRNDDGDSNSPKVEKSIHVHNEVYAPPPNEQYAFASMDALGLAAVSVDMRQFRPTEGRTIPKDTLRQ